MGFMPGRGAGRSPASNACAPRGTCLAARFPPYGHTSTWPPPTRPGRQGRTWHAGGVRGRNSKGAVKVSLLATGVSSAFAAALCHHGGRSFFVFDLITQIAQAFAASATVTSPSIADAGVSIPLTSTLAVSAGSLLVAGTPLYFALVDGVSVLQADALSARGGWSP